MHPARNRCFALAIMATLTACGGQTDAPSTVPRGQAAAPPGVGADSGTAAIAGAGDGEVAGATKAGPMTPAVLDKDGAPVALVAFDPGSVPLASAAPGALPVFSMPRGYTTTQGPEQRAFARFPFRLGDGVHWVEGASWSARIGVDDEAFPDKEYSPLEVRRNLEAVLAQAGARKVYDGPLQRDLYYGTLQAEIGDAFIEVVNHAADAPTQVFVLRHAERTVWVQLVFDSGATGVVAVDETPFQATARWSDTFPYLAFPTGYVRNGKPLQRDYDGFPFWTGTAFEEVEGKAYAVDFAAGDNTNSMHEVRRNLEAMMHEAGGVLVHAGPVPAEQSYSISFERKSPYGNAAGYSWNEGERSTWRVDLDGGRQVWVHARLDPRAAGWVVVEREAFEQTSTLLPADALKKRIDADGRVAIHVNFAADKADIAADSKPQIDQVVVLLRADTGLRLSVDGHTDATGDAARNRTLSELRAQAVVAALVADGIGANRLEAKGYGADRPVADNATDAGKASNRRVELVKR